MKSAIIDEIVRLNFGEMTLKVEATQCSGEKQLYNRNVFAFPLVTASHSNLILG